MYMVYGIQRPNEILSVYIKFISPFWSEAFWFYVINLNVCLLKFEFYSPEQDNIGTDGRFARALENPFDLCATAVDLIYVSIYEWNGEGVQRNNQKPS